MAAPRATTKPKVISGTAETVPPTITIYIGSKVSQVTLIRDDITTVEQAQEFMAHAWRIHRHGEETGETLPELRTR